MAFVYQITMAILNISHTHELTTKYTNHVLRVLQPFSYYYKSEIDMLRKPDTSSPTHTSYLIFLLLL